MVFPIFLHLFKGPIMCLTTTVRILSRFSTKMRGTQKVFQFIIHALSWIVNNKGDHFFICRPVLPLKAPDPPARQDMQIGQWIYEGSVPLTQPSDSPMVPRYSYRPFFLKRSQIPGFCKIQVMLHPPPDKIDHANLPTKTSEPLPLRRSSWTESRPSASPAPPLPGHQG